jgi:hypothetical protein
MRSDNQAIEKAHPFLAASAIANAMIKAVHPIAQCLAIHAADARRRLAVPTG